VVYGGSALAGTLELSALTGRAGFRMNGASTGDRLGYSVSGAGDVNGDGFADLLIGATDSDPNGASSGQSYVVYGGSALPGAIELSALAGSAGFRVNGNSTSDFSGVSVSGAGDVDGDGFADVVIGARGADPNGEFSGQSYVVYGDGEGLGGVFYTVTPCRLLDTRGGSPLISGFEHVLEVPPSCGVPADARAITVNLTVVGATAGGEVVAYPSDLATPGTSTLSFSVGQTRANNAVVLFAADGSGSVAFLATLNGGVGTVHLIVDVTGFFK
jgi:hypothetical protein